MEDIDIVCESKRSKECEATFIFTAGEQEYYKTKGFNPPKRCRPCRDEHKRWLAKQGENQGRNENTFRDRDILGE
jgi:hypothetical protein